MAVNAVLRLAACLGLVLGVAGCGAAIKPFQRDLDAPPADLARLGPESVGIEVGLIKGTTLPMAALIADYTARAFLDRDIPAAPAPSLSSGYVLSGWADPDNPSAPHVVEVHWTLTNRAGEVVGTHVQGFSGPMSDWEYGSERAIVEVADGTAAAVSRIVLGAAADIIEGQTVDGIWVGPVRGAPGDGNQALRRALRLALKGKGEAVRDTAAEASARVLGTVSLTDTGADTQTIAILWEVQRPDGSIVGKAEQSNAIPAGSLDGPWGQVASYATAAVVDAVIDLAERIGPVAKPKDGASAPEVAPASGIKAQP